MLATIAMVLSFFDYLIIAVIMSMFGAGASAVFSSQDKARLERLESKVDQLLRHAGVDPQTEGIKGVDEPARPDETDGLSG